MPADNGDILRITAVTQFQALDLFNNVFHFQNQGANLSSDDLIMGGIARLMDDLWTEINGSVSDQLNYIEVIGQNVTAARLMPTKDWPDLVNGGSLEAAASTQVSANVIWRTLRPKTRCTKYFPGYAENALLDGGELGATQVTELNALADLLLGTIVTADADLIFGAYNAGLARFTPVIGRATLARTRTQRRRRIGQGS